MRKSVVRLEKNLGKERNKKEKEETRKGAKRIREKSVYYQEIYHEEKKMKKSNREVK